MSWITVHSGPTEMTEVSGLLMSLAQTVGLPGPGGPGGPLRPGLTVGSVSAVLPRRPLDAL